MKKIEFNAYGKEILEQLQKGAFLTVKDKDGKVNTMTIAWGSLGFMWNKPIFTAMVRYSRFTYDLIENADDFTVSFPLNNQLKKELAFCGSKSGKEIDKFAACNLTALKGMDTNTPIIKECDLHIECKIVYKQAMEEKAIIDKEIKEKKYANEDYHVLYYGEIRGVYLQE